MSKQKCKVPDCNSTSIHLRDLCRSCYLYAASLTFHKITTWDSLEATGCVGPAAGQIQSPKRPARTQWFARGAGMTPDALTYELRVRSAAYVSKRTKQKGRK